MKTIIMAFLLFIFVPYALASDSTYDAVVTGKTCQGSSNQSLSCSYKVGKSLLIEISSIGSPDSGIAFLKSDYDGDYYGKYGMLHGCIIITGMKNISFGEFESAFAFISPKNGKIYKTWQECKSGM